MVSAYWRALVNSLLVALSTVLQYTKMHFCFFVFTLLSIVWGLERKKNPLIKYNLFPLYTYSIHERTASTIYQVKICNILASSSITGLACPCSIRRFVLGFGLGRKRSFYQENQMRHLLMNILEITL